ncbi:hypothetical protein SSPO_052320 [Streptomyces antimycoticus]|uniref:NurA domain-containing protein n=1 Tax=Streptomyces antimycoticus TaxID=68175 RepID=A0A499UL55_9ACTN|nr:hypothetical protein [Streptomyces antimycoticus]BBJ42514.1 hypothetical protein SSPO_052320 [Streptomyces antimycoticus]
MPYDQERASRIGHVQTALSPAITEAMERWQTPALEVGDPDHITERLTPLESLSRDERPEPTFAIAFDGSNQEVEARPGYPSVRVGYMQIAGVYVDIFKFLGANSSGLVDARQLERAQITQTVNSVLPGSNVFLKGITGRDTWRAEFDRSFAESEITDFGKAFTLTDALMTIHGKPGAPASSLALSKCPTCGAPDQRVTASGGVCAVPDCMEKLYPTDVLRGYEEFTDDGENALTLTRAMNMAERLLLISYIDGFYRMEPRMLSQGIFITDGPLAVYGPAAPMKSKFLDYWSQLCVAMDQRDIAPPLLVGIEKTGRFVDHAHVIERHIPNGHVMMLDTPYVNRYVANQKLDHHYGKDEFYGRRFIYKTSTGEILVVTIPRVPGGRPYEKPIQDSNGDFMKMPSEKYESYPTLRAILETLDLMQTQLYPNAVIPVALAHSASSLPLGTGRSVLTLLAQRSLGMPQDSVGLSRFKPPKHR